MVDMVILKLIIGHVWSISNSDFEEHLDVLFGVEDYAPMIIIT